MHFLLLPSIRYIFWFSSGIYCLMICRISFVLSLSLSSVRTLQLNKFTGWESLGIIFQWKRADTNKFTEQKNPAAYKSHIFLSCVWHWSLLKKLNYKEHLWKNWFSLMLYGSLWWPEILLLNTDFYSVMKCVVIWNFKIIFFLSVTNLYLRLLWLSCKCNSNMAQIEVCNAMALK